MPNLEVQGLYFGPYTTRWVSYLYDRLIASRMGYYAVECLMEGRHNVFVGIVNNRMHYTPLE